MGCCNSKNDDVNKTDIQTITNNKNPVSTQNTNNSSNNSGSNETNNITEHKSKSNGVSNTINLKSKNNDSKSSMDSSDESSISTENNEQTDKLKSKSSTKSDNGKLNESRVVLSDSSKDDLSQGKDDKSVTSQNDSSLDKQKYGSNKSFIRPDNGHKSNAESDEESYKRVNNAWSISESDEESSIPENNVSLNRESDEESYIPRYLTFTHDIKLKTHNRNVIEFETNPLRMEFEVPVYINTLFVVKIINDNNSKIADAVFSQINPANSDTIVQVAIPRKGEKFRFQIFAKDLRDKRSKFVYSNQLFLTRTESNENDALKFCKVYPRGQNCFIYSPIEYYLTSNSKYEFKYFIKDALDVAIVDSSKKVKYMNREDQHIWVLITTLKAKGIVNVLAKFDEKSDYDYICNYEVI